MANLIGIYMMRDRLRLFKTDPAFKGSFAEERLIWIEEAIVINLQSVQISEITELLARLDEEDLKKRKK